MKKHGGKNVPLTPFRRLVADLMHFSQKVPAVTAERKIELSAVREARKHCALRPSFSVIFAKAYAMVASDYPQLRQSYLTIPWPRLYEHPNNVASVNVEREINGEPVVLFCLIRRPENRPLAELATMIRHYQTAPVEELRHHQRSVATGRIPWPFRRWFWYIALNMFGRRRCHNFGTFGLSSVGALGAGILNMIPILTSSLHYSVLDEQSRSDVRLSWDHRVFDGGTGARVLRDLESAMNNEILNELRRTGTSMAA